MEPIEAFFEQLRAVHFPGAGVAETSYYTPLATLLNELGGRLKPKVRCIVNQANKGAGIADGGLFTADQLRRLNESEALGQVPARGALEVKPPSEDLEQVVRSASLGADS